MYCETKNASITFQTEQDREKASELFCSYFLHRDDIQKFEFVDSRVLSGTIDRKAGFFEIRFKVTSNRLAQLYWQVEQIMDFFEKQNGVKEINVDTMIEGDCFSWVPGRDKC
jgi:hypothetical protein